MKITAITIENFKGISNPARIELKPITLLFGANSVGKSTIVQALHYVRELLERENADADRCLAADESMDLGGFRNMVYSHELDKAIKFRIEMNLENDNLPVFHTELIAGSRCNITEVGNDVSQFLSLESAWVELEVRWDGLQECPFVSLYSIGYSEKAFVKIEKNELDAKAVITYLDLAAYPARQTVELSPARGLLINLHKKVLPGYGIDDGIVRNYQIGKYGTFAAPEWTTSCIPQWNYPLYLELDYCDEDDVPIEDKYLENPYENISEFLGYLSQLVIGPGKLLLDELKTFRYIGPIRKIPSRDYRPPRFDDETRWASGLAAWDLLHKSHDGLTKVCSYWLGHKDRLNTGYSLKTHHFKKIDTNSDLYKVLIAKGIKGKAAAHRQLEELPEERQLVLHDDRRGLDVLPQDVGIGISQILPVVVCALDPCTNIMMVEQPELHIHPGLQCSLGDLFISQIQHNITFIIETHSEHLLLRLLRRIRENSESELPDGVTGLSPDQVSVNYVELTEEGLRIRPMEITEDGDFNNRWPNGFFAERAKELF